MSNVSAASSDDVNCYRTDCCVNFGARPTAKTCPIYVDAAVLAQRLGVTASQLQPLLDRLAEQRLVFAGLTSGTYGVREWPPAWGQED